MNRFWWQLPGPSRFVEGVARDLRNGDNVALGFPRPFAGATPRTAVRRALGEAWRWRVLDAAGVGDPVPFLYRQCVPDADAGALRTPAALAEEEALAGQILWIDRIDEADAWRAFFEDYRDACHHTDHERYGQFVAPFVGRAARELPPAGTCLRPRHWRDVVSTLDMRLFVAHHLPRRSLPPLLHRVRVNMIVELALWDAELALHLVEAPRALHRPHALLHQLAKERGWEDASCTKIDDRDRAWRRGMADRVEGTPRLHAALFAEDDPCEEIERRLWSAQVGDVLSFVETRRRALLRRLGERLCVPHEVKKDGRVVRKVEKRSDLEIGHIYYQITRSTIDVEKETRRRVRELRDIRNDLAHLQPLGSERLRDLHSNGAQHSAEEPEAHRLPA